MLSLGKRNRRERNKTPDLPRGGEVAEFTRKAFEIPVKQLPREQPHNKGNNCQAGGKHRGRIWSAFGIGEIGAAAQVTWLGATSGAVTGKCGVTAPALPPRVYLPGWCCQSLALLPRRTCSHAGKQGNTDSQQRFLPLAAGPAAAGAAPAWFAADLHPDRAENGQSKPLPAGLLKIM